MPWSVLQSAQQTGGGATTTVKAYASNVVQGSHLYAAISSGGPDSPAGSITDSQGNSWSQVGSALQASSGDWIQIFYAIAGASGANTVTATFPGVAQGNTLTIFEVSGGAIVSPLLTSAEAIGTSTTPASGAITPSMDGCLFFAAEVDPAADGTTITAGTDFTIRETQLISSTLQRIGTETYEQPVAASHNGNFTLGASAQWACKLAVFRPLAIQDVLEDDGMLPIPR